MEKKECLLLLAMLKKADAIKTDDEQTAKIWYDQIKELSFDGAFDVVREWISTERYYIKPSDIIKRYHYKRLKIQSANRAWVSVNTVDDLNSLPYEIRQTVKNIGGLAAIKNQAGFAKKAFVEEYEEIVAEVIKSGRKEKKQITGSSELEVLKEQIEKDLEKDTKKTKSGYEILKKLGVDL